MAGLVGRSEEWLRDVERGRQGAPGLEMLLRLGQALGVRGAGGARGPPPPPPPPKHKTPPRGGGGRGPPPPFGVLSRATTVPSPSASARRCCSVSTSMRARRTVATCPGATSASRSRPAGVSTASTPRSSASAASRRTYPAFSSWPI
ncbi:helix-turn-helix domain-containing protein [Nocardia farcinica]|uniref:helix-turn-helix domain-containing protein n=1 Tax=Nocardia farcinica TaxID=37329 RepID=UPI0024543494|nr:helix-turn-helix domain-containing protein [Nocardia farcinica]